MAAYYRHTVALIAVFFLLGAPAGAVDATSPKPSLKQVPPIASPWQFQFTPYAWLIFVTGDQKIGSRTYDVNTNIFDIIDKSDHLYAWMSYQELRNGPFSLYTDVIWSRMRFSDTKSGVFPIGPLNRSSLSVVANAKIWLDFAIIEPGATFQLAKWSTGAASPNGGFVPNAAIDLIAGARYWLIQPDINLNVTAALNIPALGLTLTRAGSISKEKTIDWWDPLVGLRLRYQPAPGQELMVRGDIGGFDVGSNLTWQALAAYSFETRLLGLDFTSYIGYRALSVDYEEGSGNKTIGLNLLVHGPIIGATFRW